MNQIPQSPLVVRGLAERVSPDGVVLLLSTPRGFPFHCSVHLSRLIGALGSTESLVRKENCIYRCDGHTIADYWDRKIVISQEVQLSEPLVWFGSPPWFESGRCVAFEGFVCLKSEGEQLLQDYLTRSMPQD